MSEAERVVTKRLAIINETLSKRCHAAAMARRVPRHIAWRVALAGGAVALATLVATASSSGATTAKKCTPGYYYAAQHASGFTTSGIGGWMSVDSLSIFNTKTQHLLNFYNITSKTTCTNAQCWSQIGYGKGRITTQISSSTAAYFEESDFYGYDVEWLPSISLAQDDYWAEFWTGATETVLLTSPTGAVDETIQLGLFDGALCVPTKTCIVLDQSWQNYYRHVQESFQTEAALLFADDCPLLTEYQYYGTNGTSTATTPNYHVKIMGGNETWHYWPTTRARTTTEDSPYRFQSLNQQWAAETWKTA